MKKGLLLLLGCGLLVWVLQRGPYPSLKSLPKTAAAQPNFGGNSPPAAPITNTTQRALAATAPKATASFFVPTTNDITAFADWVGRNLAGDASATVIRGEALAWKRQQAMLELIQQDPERAVELAAPFSWRKQLPADITRYFEHWIDGRGDLEVAMAESRSLGQELVYRWAGFGKTRLNAYVYGRRLREITQERIPLHGIVLAGKIALTDRPIRTIDAEEASELNSQRKQTLDRFCAVCGRAASADSMIGDIGGETRFFCSQDHVSMANENIVVAAIGGSGSVSALAAGGSSAWTQGRKDVLYIRANFPDDLTEPNSEASAYSTMDQVNGFYVENSYDQTWFSTTVTPLLTLPQIKAWYATAGPGALLSDARAVARKAGYDTANYDRDIVSHTTVPGYDWAGLGVVGGKGTWLQGYGTGVTAHELGHNEGLGHANFWKPYTPYAGYYGPGKNIEYGNIFDTMGSGGSHFGALFKTQLDWIPDTAIHAVASNGLYRIYPLDTAMRTTGRFYGAHVRKDFERDYWVEFRNRFPANVAMKNGVLLHWSSWSDGPGVGLIDTTPTTASLADAAVVIGRTFSDRIAGVHITPIARGTTGTEPWIDVQINRDDGIRDIPCCLKVESDLTNAAPGQLVHFHATVADRDDSTFAYAWYFDDGTFSTNNSYWTAKSWSTPGEHVVRCEVSDMRGGRASANVITTVGAASDFRVTGLVVDEHGEPLENVVVTLQPDSIPVFTDSYGTFVAPGMNGTLDFNLAKYGYAFEPVGWSNPFFVTSNTVNLTFLGRALTNVTLTISTNVLIENVPTAGELALTRNAGLDADLEVQLYLSGSATVPADITFSPPLTAGRNNVVIPAGTNRVVFQFSPVNNNTVEPTKVLYLSLRETTNYVVTTLGEQPITILDDDLATGTTVSVATLDGPVLENGMNPTGFRFTRTGSTASDLPVNFSIGGTATASVDYAALLGTVVIPAGSDSVVAALRIFDDKEVEPNETVSVTITPSPTYSISTSSATAPILDDDLLVVTVSPTGNGLTEPSGSGQFTIKRDGDITSGILVYYSMAGTAISGIDYITPSGSVTIPAGETSARVTITALDDALLEGNETVTLIIATNSAYDVGIPGSATLTLRDDERVKVSITATDATASEPGDDFGQIRISRTGSTSSDLTVNFVVNGTALPGSDYVPIESPVVIPAGSSSINLAVIPFEDFFIEDLNESVILTLVAGNNYDIAGAPDARVDITDNDQTGKPAVGFTFSTFAAPESESPGLPVALSYTSTKTVTVQYQVIGGTASTSDYSLPPGTLTFEPGEWAKSIPMPIVNDTVAEPDETIRVVLFNPTEAAHDGIQTMTYTILDDDTCAVSVSATAATASEFGPSTSNFRISRTGSTNADQLVNFQITGTASTPSDCPALGTFITIPAGITYVDLPVTPIDDGVVELDEELTLTLISAPNSKIVSPAKATITILDANPNNLPTVTLTTTNQPNVVEGGATGAFTFTRTGPTTNALTVYLATGGTATSGADYSALPATVTFPVGQAVVNLPVTAVDDAQVEGEEIITASLITRGTYRVAFPGTANLTLQDNDQTVRIDASDVTAYEGGKTGSFTFTRFGTTNNALQVFYTIGGTAGNGVDYSSIANSFTIPPGNLTGTLTIQPLNDALVESTETVSLTLQPNSAYTVATPAAATVMILDDEPTVSVRANVAELPEASQAPAIITVHRDGDPTREFVARLDLGGSATYGVDYRAIATNLAFTCGIVDIDVLISPTNEAIPESEALTATLLPDSAYTRSSDNSASITFIDGGTDREPQVTITSPTADLIYLLPTNVNMILEAEVSDPDGDPLTWVWSQVSGPEALVFGDVMATNTTVSFTNSGIYTLRLTADDGQLQHYAEVTVVVGALSRLTNNPAGEELLHWTFDEGTGPTVNDSSGKEHTGTIHGPAQWIAAGTNGGALALTGTNNYVEAVNGSDFLNGLTRFTLAGWIKPASSPLDAGLISANDSGAPTLSLSARSTATCGTAANVIEGSLATSCGEANQVSAANAILGGWEHVALTWSNGVAPKLYLNGHEDQAGRRKIPLLGELANCPQFLLGKGPTDLPATWAGQVDDLRVFSWQFNAAEIGTFVATNFGPVVEVSTNLIVPVITPVEISGVVTDDGRPVPPGTVAYTWLQTAGPLPVSLTNSHALTNVVSFTLAGDYVFRIIADDGQVKIYDDLEVTVIEPPYVSVFASDPFAAELGPDPGELTFNRQGALDFELLVNIAISGTASNGADFVQIPLSNSVAFPIGVDQVTVPIVPFLDHRTEGDETFTVSIVSNVIYTISSGEATVTIQDSPYGMWNIAHFTLEELTDPTLSGEEVDFDHDGLLNFAEYAADRSPKAPETNAPLQTAIELNPGDSLNHITLTYQRRLPPTDVAYQVAVSTDLLTWQSGPAFVQEISSTPDANGFTETVKARLVAPWPANMAQFVTVRVWLLSTGP